MTEPFDVAMLVLRTGVGLVILAHGVNHARGRERTTKWFASIGFRSPAMQWFFSTATELGVAALLILGLLTAPAAAGLVAVMFVAFWTVHRKNGFFIFRPGEGWEYVTTLALTGLTLAIAGPGELSIDGAVEIDGTTVATLLDGWVGVLIVAAGLVLAAIQIATFFHPEEATAQNDAR
jgi:putative oxidoreductase